MELLALTEEVESLSATLQETVNMKRCSAQREEIGCQTAVMECCSENDSLKEEIGSLENQIEKFAIEKKALTGALEKSMLDGQALISVEAGLRVGLENKARGKTEYSVFTAFS